MKKLSGFLFVGIVVAVNLGCKGDPATASDDKAIRSGFDKKTFDINDVPLKDRARVQGFINHSKEMAAKGKQPASGN